MIPLLRKLVKRYRTLKKEVKALREELSELKADLARAALTGEAPVTIDPAGRVWWGVGGVAPGGSGAPIPWANPGFVPPGVPPIGIVPLGPGTAPNPFLPPGGTVIVSNTGESH